MGVVVCLPLSKVLAFELLIPKSKKCQKPAKNGQDIRVELTFSPWKTLTSLFLSKDYCTRKTLIVKVTHLT